MTAKILVLLTRLITGVSVHFVNRFDISNKQRIFYSNHSSHLDFLLIWSILPDEQRKLTRPVAAKDYWGVGKIKKFFSTKILNAVLVHRKWRDVLGERNPIEKLLDTIKSGDSLVIFPEGTRSLDFKLKNFKSGIYHLAESYPELEFVPIYIDNLSRVLPKGEFLFIPILTRAVIGEPFRIHENETKSDFLTRARNNLIKLYPKESLNV